ncbi:MAG: hypothetical protein E5V40_32095, partial [Mesorhizobium sp.]
MRTQRQDSMRALRKRSLAVAHCVPDRSVGRVDDGNSGFERGDLSLDKIALSEERGNKPRVRVGIEFSRLTDLHEASITHDGDAIRHR